MKPMKIYNIALVLMLASCSTAAEEAAKRNPEKYVTIREIIVEGGNPDDGSVNNYEEVTIKVKFYNDSDLPASIDTTIVRSDTADVVVEEGANTDGCGYIVWHGKCVDMDAASESPAVQVAKIRTSTNAAGMYKLDFQLTGRARISEEPEEWKTFQVSTTFDLNVIAKAPILGVTYLESVGSIIDRSGTLYQKYEVRVSNTGDAASLEPLVKVTALPVDCCVIGDYSDTTQKSVDLNPTSVTYQEILEFAKESQTESFWLGVLPGQTPASLHFEFSDKSERTYPSQDLQ